MTEETKEFIENWESKILNHDTTELSGLFDKFTDLFTIYNRLYNESFAILKQNNSIPNSRNGDFQKATVFIVQFLSAKSIIDKLTANGNQKDIDEVRRLISNDVFNINLEDGNPRKDFDLELLANLQSNSVDIKAQAVLSFVYNIRNNKIHGHKDYVEYQRLIVEPAINILESIIELFKQKL
jgi:hypothetical protein